MDITAHYRSTLSNKMACFVMQSCLISAHGILTRLALTVKACRVQLDISRVSAANE